VSPKITVVIPSYNPRPDELQVLYASLRAQSFADFEAVVVDDASPDADYGALSDPRFRVIRQSVNGGPARARNAGAAAAETEFLFFTDTDCELGSDTLQAAVDRLEVDAITMGNTITKTRTAFGKAVALLGFPGGGALGFDRVWRVDDDGYTNSFSSCALAFRKSVFENLGRFNETFPVAGGEDTVLARRAVERGVKIRYAPEQVVYHVEQTSLRGFLRWQLVRGRGNYHIRQHVASVGGYLRLRLWTFKNSFVQAGPLYALPVFVMLVLSVKFQSAGYYLEKAKQRAAARA